MKTPLLEFVKDDVIVQMYATAEDNYVIFCNRIMPPLFIEGSYNRAQVAFYMRVLEAMKLIEYVKQA